MTIEPMQAPNTAPAQEDATGLVGHVLVVDDSRLQRTILARTLRRRGYRVTEADSGIAALEACRAARFDLIISDWLMPGMTGPQFCEAFRALDHGGYTYFILLTSKSDRKDVAEGLDRGADDFLTKPVNAAELRARIKAGERILSMHRTVEAQNRQLTDALETLNALYAGVNRDLEEARRLQQSLVPDWHPKVTGGKITLMLQPSGAVGGDLVGSFRITDSRVGLFAIDVSGHGIASALMTARLAGFLTATSSDRNIALTADERGVPSMRPTAEVCARLNEVFEGDTSTDMYFTMVLADCDLRSGRVTMTQAGHPPPAIQRADGRIETVGDGGLPVGLLPGAQYTSFAIDLAPGDRLLIYSDGITECEDGQGRQLGDAGLFTLLKATVTLDGPAFGAAVQDRLKAFSGQPDFGDDVSCVLLSYSGPAAPQDAG